MQLKTFNPSNMNWLMCRRDLEGINYGIELHSDVVEYAKKNLESLIKKSNSFDNQLLDLYCQSEWEGAWHG